MTRCKLPLILAVSTLVAGCHLFGDDQAAIDRWGGLLSDLRYQWDAEPGIDVTTGAAIPVRAYIESRILAQSTGNLDYAYPGFTRAVPSDGDPNLRPNVNHPRDDALIGNSRYHILSLNRTGATVTATVCNYYYTLASEQDDDKYESAAAGRSEPQGVDALRITLSAPPEPSPLPPQVGPSPAPSADVFGDWRITEFEFPTKPGFASQWPNYDADEAKCVENAPDSPERRTFLVSGEHPRSDFPTSPPSPGWPEKKD
ncbi:MAG: hypothetical protein QOE20_3976 [Mycobacterium sp.]|nr:hypothetical protein [Mycobacterium sp.]